MGRTIATWLRLWSSLGSDQREKDPPATEQAISRNYFKDIQSNDNVKTEIYVTKSYDDKSYNTLSHENNGWQFANTFQLVFLEWFFFFFLNEMLALVQVMAWFQTGNKSFIFLTNDDKRLLMPMQSCHRLATVNQRWANTWCFQPSKLHSPQC